MPVDSQHPEYDKNFFVWRMCQDLSDGEEAIKAGGVKYLPKLGGQTSEQYQSFKNRGEFFNAFGRTSQGLTGSVFRKDPVVEIPNKIESYQDTITDTGQGLFDLSTEITQLIIEKGRGGLLVDKGLKGESNPYISVCSPEKIINWNSAYVEGKEVLQRVVLRDVIFVPDPKDEYETKEVEQIRVFKLVEGKCIAEIYLRGEKDEDYVLQNEAVPLVIQGKVIDFIPFVFLGSEKNSTEINKPPLIDLAWINLSHWKKSVDMAHGLHYAALPTPCAAGFDKKQKFEIGPQKVWVGPEGATSWYLEFSGEGLQKVSEALDRNERMMAVLGARLIEKTRDRVETAETARIRQAGETSSLVRIVKTISQGIEESLRLVARWESLPEDDISFNLNTDFVSIQLDAQQITALMQALQGGGISQDTFIYQMSEGEILPPDTTIEDEKELIEASGMNEFDEKEEFVTEE